MIEYTNTRMNEMVDPGLHVWGWEIPLYLFLGGLVAGMMILGGLALYQGRYQLFLQRTSSLVRSGRTFIERLNDPRANADYYLDPGNASLQAPFTLGGMEVKHEPGKMWLFPSYVLHEVFPYFGSDPRIIVAFNCWISSDKDRKYY